MATTAKRPAPNPLRAGLRVGGASEPTVFVIYGASGDLSQRKLLPAIYNLPATVTLSTGDSVPVTAVGLVGAGLLLAPATRAALGISWPPGA